MRSVFRSTIFKRASGFTAVPLLSILSSLLLLPLLARYGGADGWVSIAIGQSIGGFAAIVIVFGWSLAGPKRVAGKSALEGSQEYWSSIVVRVLVSLAAIPAAMAVSAFLAPTSGTTLAMMMALASSLMGFSPAWYWVGTGAPREMVIFEAFPRLAATLAAFGVLLLTKELLWYPALLVLSTLAGYLWFSFRLLTRDVIKSVPLKLALGMFRVHLVPALTVLTSGAYTSITVGLVTAVAPIRASTAFVSGDKLYRIATQAISISGNALQGWVSESAEASQTTRRMRLSLLLNAGLGIVGGLGIAMVGPWASELLFGPELAVGFAVMAFLGLAFFWLSVNSALGRLVLTPLGMNRVVLFSTVAGAVVGVPGILLGASTAGALGAVIAIAFAEFVVSMVQIVALVFQSLRSRSAVALPAERISQRA